MVSSKKSGLSGLEELDERSETVGDAERGDLCSLLGWRIWEVVGVWAMRYGEGNRIFLVRLDPAEYGRKRWVFGEVVTRKCIYSPKLIQDTLIGNGTELLHRSQFQASACSKDKGYSTVRRLMSTCCTADMLPLDGSWPRRMAFLTFTHRTAAIARR